MFESRHAPRYLRWFDQIALWGGLLVLLALMLMLSAVWHASQKKAESTSWHTHADETLQIAESSPQVPEVEKEDWTAISKKSGPIHFYRR
jgi:hypothetical protein